MAKPDLQHDRLQQMIKQVEEEFGPKLYALLMQVNRERLHGKGQIKEAAITDEHSLRWMMKWKEAKINYEMSVVIRVEDTGREAHVSGVWVHRHASTPLDFEGHTPTTRMRRVTNLSIKDIHSAIEAEWG